MSSIPETSTFPAICLSRSRAPRVERGEGGAPRAARRRVFGGWRVSQRQARQGDAALEHLRGTTATRVSSSESVSRFASAPNCIDARDAGVPRPSVTCASGDAACEWTSACQKTQRRVFVAPRTLRTMFRRDRNAACSWRGAAFVALVASRGRGQRDDVVIAQPQLFESRELAEVRRQRRELVPFQTQDFQRNPTRAQARRHGEAPSVVGSAQRRCARASGARSRRSAVMVRADVHHLRGLAQLADVLRERGEARVSLGHDSRLPRRLRALQRAVRPVVVAPELIRGHGDVRRPIFSKPSSICAKIASMEPARRDGGGTHRTTPARTSLRAASLRVLGKPAVARQHSGEIRRNRYTAIGRFNPRSTIYCTRFGRNRTRPDRGFVLSRKSSSAPREKRAFSSALFAPNPRPSRALR